MVVDDDPNFVQMVSTIFGKEFDVLDAMDGSQALAIAVRERPAVILLDVMMPQLSGGDVIKRLLADPTTREIPVIMVTASNMPLADQVALKREPNVRDYVQKPCDFDVLRACVHRLARR